MDDFIFKKDERVLLLGEGNFTFCQELLSLIKIKNSIHEAGKFTNVYATCFEDETRAIINDEIQKFLLDEGVNVIFGVDATNLGQHKTIAQEIFDRIIFNFPHISGKMRMDLNRSLLAKFFISAASVLAYGGSVIVSLCAGQGGTPADKPRRYDDTWKVVENGAAGGLVLVRVSPWSACVLSNYRSSGFRGGKKSFNTEGALVHKFKRVEPLDTRFVPENLMGFHSVPFCDGLEVPIAYQRLLLHDRNSWKTTIHHFVESQIATYIPKHYECLEELPMATSVCLDDSQIDCRFMGEPAFLRTSFYQVIPQERFTDGRPFYASGVIFRKLDDDFSSYPGSYKMLICGSEANEVVKTVSTSFKVPVDSGWCLPVEHNLVILDLDRLIMKMFGDHIGSVKVLWQPRTKIVFSGDALCSSEWSLYPATYTFDLSFSSNGPLSDEPFLNLMHNLADHLVESITLQSRYSPEGSYTVYHCFRITYRSYEKPLHRACVVDYQHNVIRSACEQYLDVAVR